MRDDNVYATIVGFVGGLVIGFVIGMVVEDFKISSLKRDAVKVGAAEYSSTTGQWQWKKKVDGQP